MKLKLNCIKTAPLLFLGTGIMAIFPNVHVAMIMISGMGIISMSISYCPYALLGQYHEIKEVWSGIHLFSLPVGGREGHMLHRWLIYGNTQLNLWWNYGRKCKKGSILISLKQKKKVQNFITHHNCPHLNISSFITAGKFSACSKSARHNTFILTWNKGVSDSQFCVVDVEALL